MQVLQSRGTRLDTADYEGRRLLHWATVHGHVHIVEWLLSEGEPLDPQDKEGKTPLIFAAYEGLDDLVRMLLEKGANVDAYDREGISALHWAALQVLLREGREAWGKVILASSVSVEQEGYPNVILWLKGSKLCIGIVTSYTCCDDVPFQTTESLTRR